jgi:hypothetical protein
MVYSLRGFRQVLKNAARSPEDYQDTIRHLARLESILSDLSRSDYSSQDVEIFALCSAIKMQATELVSTITKFSSKAQNYDDSLGSSASSGIHHGTIAKLRWAIDFTKQDLSRFKAVVSERVLAIDLLHKSFMTYGYIRVCLTNTLIFWTENCH